MTKFKFTDNSKQVLSAMDNAKEKALKMIGLTAEGYAIEKAAVDTGRMRASINHQVKDDSVYIGTNVEYAPFVELGTIHQKAQPFLKPAATQHTNEYKNIVKDVMKSG